MTTFLTVFLRGKLIIIYLILVLRVCFSLLKLQMPQCVLIIERKIILYVPISKKEDGVW